MIARALWLALVMVVAACAVEAQAGTVDERCCPMSGNFVQGVDADPDTFNPNSAAVAPGAIVQAYNGGGNGLGIVAQTGPSTRTLVRLPYLLARIASATWVPGAGGSGDGVLTVTVEDQNGDPMVNQMVNVAWHGAGAIAGVSLSGGVGVLAASVAVGTDAIVQGFTQGPGQLALALNGATGTAMTITVSLLGSGNTGAINSQDVTLP